MAAKKKKPGGGIPHRGEGHRMWRDALKMELFRADSKTAGKALERIARIVVHNALNGDLDCISEIANRLDGRPSTAVDTAVEDKIEKMIVQWGQSPRALPSPGLGGGQVKGPSMIDITPKAKDTA